MRKISRRDFLSDSLALMSSTLFLPADSLSRGTFLFQESQESLKDYPSYLGLEEKGELSRRVEKLYEMYEDCTLCPRDCRVNRTKGQVGKCQGTNRVKVSSANPHFGEEPPLVGQKGSGTIFFSNCGLRCVYCQNYQISLEGQGVEISDQRLAEAMINLQKMGCHNINLVTPTHYLPSIVSAVQKAVPMGLRIPLVYNTGGYEKPEVLQLMDGIVDFYLPDCKYMDPAHAARYSSEAYSYPHYIRLSLKEMHRQVGDLRVDRKGVAIRGLIIRHLVLPNRISGTEKFCQFVAENLSKTTCLNIMRQYRPEYKAFDYPEIARRITRSEYAEAIAWAKKYGLTSFIT